MAYFPFMMDIEDKTALIVGGGRIALHKAKLMLDFGAKLKVVASEVCSELKELQRLADGGTSNDRVSIIRKEFTYDDLDNVDFVVAAIDDAALSTYISVLCRDKGIPVNVVDKKEECSFIFPAVIKQGDMVVAVSTGGNSPAGAGFIKRRINETLPDYYGDMVSRLGRYRDYVIENVPSQENRKKVFNALLEYGDEHGGDIPEELLDKLVSICRAGV
jgi:siroheme synthase-like protein